MAYQKLFKNGAEFCAISGLVVTPGRVVLQHGVPVGKNSDTCVFKTDKSIISFDPLTDDFALVDPATEESRSLKIQQVTNGRTVSGVLEG